MAAADGSDSIRITPRALGEVQYPAWSPDGALIAFQISKPSGFALYTIRPDGSGLRELTPGDAYTEWPMWSPDDKRIAYGLEGEQSALWTMAADGSSQHELRDGLGVPASWAPGAWLVSNCPLAESRTGVCGVSPDGSQQVTLLNGIDAGFPAWSP